MPIEFDTQPTIAQQSKQDKPETKEPLEKTALKTLPSITFVKPGAPTAPAATDTEGPECKKIYHFPTDISSFTQTLQSQKEQDTVKHRLLYQIFKTIYKENKIPTDIADFFTIPTAAISDEVAKKIFIVLDNTAGYGENGKHHSGVDFAFFGEDFRHKFFKLRQSCFKEEIYKDKNEKVFQFFSGVPHADLHDWTMDGADFIINAATSFEKVNKHRKDDNQHKINSYKLLISSYLSALEDAENSLDTASKGKNEDLISKLKLQLESTKTRPDEFKLALKKEELRAIQEANCILKLAGAKKADKVPVLTPPGAFAGPLEFDSNKNEFSSFIKSALEKMDDSNRPKKVVVNCEGVKIIEKDASSSAYDITAAKAKPLLKSYFHIYSQQSFSTLATHLGIEINNLIIDCCAANFPMSLIGFATSQGKKPTKDSKTVEEKFQHIAITSCPLGTKVKIFDGDKTIGETSMGHQQTFFNAEWLRKALIDKLVDCESSHFQDYSLDFLTLLSIAKEKSSKQTGGGLVDSCISTKYEEEDNQILLYLFLDTFTEQEKNKTSFFNTMSQLLKDSNKQIINKQIENHSSSESPNPPIYKGWGAGFNQGGISEEKGSTLLVKIDEIFPHSKLKDVVKGDTIKITLTRDDINNLKNNGQFDVGKVAKLIRNQESLTIQKNAGINLTIEKENKNHFYKGEDDKYIGFLASLDMSEEKVKEQERAIKKAFGQKKEESLAESAKQSPKGKGGGEAVAEVALKVREEEVAATPSGKPSEETAVGGTPSEAASLPSAQRVQELGLTVTREEGIISL